MLAITSSPLVSAIVMFVVAWVFLFVLYYFTTTSYIEYGDRNSRIIYCLVYSLNLSLVLALGFAILPDISIKYGIIQALLIGLVMVVFFTFAQAYLIRYLVQNGIIRMHRKDARR